MARPRARKPPARELGTRRIVEQVAVTALPVCLTTAALTLQQVLAPGGVRPPALFVAATLALVASALALLWSRDEVPWSSHRGLRVGILAVLVAGSVVAIWQGRAMPEEQVEAYRAAMRSVCHEDGAAERTLQAGLEPVRAELVSLRSPADMPKTMDRGLRVMQRGLLQERDLVGRVEALTPPESLADTHAQLVAVWKRKLDLDGQALDGLERRIAATANDLNAFADAMRELLASLQGQPKLEGDKDKLLRQLAGSGCEPIP